MNKQTILVQGAGSHVGCALVHTLCDKMKNNPNFTLRAGFANLQEPNCKKCQQICECVPLDLSNKNLFNDALKNVNKLVIIPPYRENRVAITNQFIDTAYTMGVRRIILISLIGANNEEIVFQKHLKTIESHLSSKTDIQYTIIRLPAFMDNFFDMVSDIKKGSLRLPTGEGKWPAIWGLDVAQFVCEVLQRDLLINEIAELTGPESLSGHDIARTFTEVIGKQVNFISISGDEWKREVTGLGMNPYKAEGILELYRWYSAGNGNRVTNEFSRILNHPPRTFTDFVRTNLEVFRVSTVTPQ
jgi:uncharacterized protein YbjT (DUF2867 family)